MRNKSYVIAIRSEKENEVQQDWVDQIRAFSGVEIQGATSDQVTVLANEDSIKRLAGELGDDFLIEEGIMRN
jgi:hypothetical protein